MPKSKKSKKIKKDKILDKIEKNYNTRFKFMEKLLDKNKEYNIKIIRDKLNIEIYEGENKILTGNAKFYGIIKTDKRFLWSYMIPGVDKRFIKEVNKIKSFSHLFENSTDKNMMLYHSILNNDSILLDDKEVESLLKLILYLNDDMYFLK